jgi:hypothetical protein
VTGFSPRPKLLLLLLLVLLLPSTEAISDVGVWCLSELEWCSGSLPAAAAAMVLDPPLLLGLLLLLVRSAAWIGSVDVAA